MSVASINSSFSKPEPGHSTPDDVERGVISISTPRSIVSRVRSHFDSEVPTTVGTDVLILLCWFTTGFLDSTIYQAYRTFVSMQTGNTVFIGLGACQNPRSTRPYSWAKSLSSLVAFLVGSLFFSRLGLLLGSRDRPRRRLTFTLSFALQTFIILLSAIVLQSNVVESRLEYIGEEIDWLHLIPIVLLSFQAPGQTFAGRQLGTPEVSTVVITSMIYDFASDFRLFKRNNAPRSHNYMLDGLAEREKRLNSKCICQSYGYTAAGSAPGNRVITIQQPVGVVGVLTPLNPPSAMIMRKVGGAIATGRSVVKRQ
ncbi:MAG: hypothetical protein OHK93_002770 [Ramalina farinacea]|uniref:Aldehyde dehydrogenase domain-containing protein n=1 Tax=Ramalina farinacea TaxID=258253 RepID=A0AA43QUN6_9LECA|nr:hypothetical protein [Ramalina farinacea]